MKNYQKKIGTALATCLLLFLWFQSLTPQTKGFFYSFFDGRGLYAPIGAGQIDLSKKGEKILIPLKPKYESGYTFSAIIPKDIGLFSGFDRNQDGLMKGVLMCPNIKTDEYSSHSFYDYGASSYKGETKFGLFTFTLNRDLLQCEDLKLELEVIKPYLNFGVREPVPFSISSNFSL